MSNRKPGTDRNVGHQPAFDWTRGMVNSTFLRPQSLAVLKLLHDNAGAVVTKEQIMEKVWPGVAVTDDSLVQCITEIRKALGDGEHTLVKTLPKRGYVYEPVLAGFAQAAAPKRQWWWLAPAFIAAALAAFSFWPRSAPPPAELPAIAVLPFANLSADPKDSKFADVMTEDVITDLSHSKDFMVIARNSVEVYKGKAVDVRDVGKALDVQFVLEGSVQALPDRVRATAQLIDASTGKHVWSERFEKLGTDVFAIEAQITTKVASSLLGYQGIVMNAARSIARRKPPASMTAFDLYLLGVDAKNKLTKESLDEAEALFDKAIGIDPNFARAYIAQSWTYSIKMVFGFMPAPEGTQKMLAAARKAVELDPSDGEAHIALATAYSWSGDFALGAAALEKGAELAPNNADVLQLASMTWPYYGRPELAVELTEKAVRLNPHYPFWYVRQRRDTLFYGRKFDEAHAMALLVTDPVAPDFALNALIAGARGDKALAKEFVEKLAAADPAYSAEFFAVTNGGFAREVEQMLLFESAQKAGLRQCMTKQELAGAGKVVPLKPCDVERARTQ